MLKQLTTYLAILGTLGIWMACATPTAVPAPTAAPPATGAPTPTTTVVDNCLKCHREKETLEKLAVKKTEKSEATQGEG